MKRKKKKRTGNETLDALKSIRKPMPPSGHFHSTKKGKRGYERREGKRIAREAY